MKFNFIQSGFCRRHYLAASAFIAIGLIVLPGCSGAKGGQSGKAGNSDSSASAASVRKIKQWYEDVSEETRKSEQLRKSLIAQFANLDETSSSPAELKKFRQELKRLDEVYASLQKKMSKATLAELSIDMENTQLQTNIRDALEALSLNRNGLLKAVQVIDQVIALREPPAETPQVALSSGSPIVPSSQGGTITGLVRDSISGTPVSGAEVGFREAAARDYFHRTQTNSQGAYHSPHLRPGDYAVDVIRQGYVTSQRSQVKVAVGRVENENVALTPPVAEGQFRITMSWTGEAPDAVRDVDSYLQVPDSSQLISFHTKGQVVSGSHLDRDDTDWVGPETVTIRSIQSGTYRYYVNNYNFRNNERALGNSMVSIQVYKGSQLVKTYRVPPGIGKTFEVFQLRNGEIYDVLSYNDRLTVH
jgi:hypothetical protein